nr:probable serine/threonine-protein kinase DDB_G0282963 isoform X1 [Bactrocera oleae]
MKLQQIQNLNAATGSGSGVYKMADLTKKMSPDNPTQILTTHDLTSLRTLQRVINTNNNNTAVDDNVIYNSHGHTNNNNNNNTTRNHNYNLSHNSNSITNGIHNHHNNSNGNASGGNLVFSTIPLDGHALFIQPSHLLPANAAAASLTSKGLQQATQTRGLVTTATNGLRTVNSINHSNISPAVSNANSFISSNSNSSNHNNNNNSLNSFLAKATILSANLSNGKASGKIFSTGGTTFSSNTNNMPTTSKYVLLQPNGNGQFTTYEGPTPAAAAAAAANGNVAAPSVGNIVLLATEPMDLNGSAAVGGDATAVGRVIATTTSVTGDNDEELRSLAWLNDSNLIKGIVTTSAAGGASGANVKRAGTANSGNICIVSAGNAHELIEELPHHVGSEEVTTTTPSGNVSTTGAGISNNTNNNNNITTPTELKASTQITALSVSDLQHLKRFGNIITTGTPITLLPQHDATTATTGRKDEPTHIFGNISGISATTTVHMGPSGTTTVVEYKSNGNIPTLQPRQLLSAAGVGNVSTGTTITPTNLSSSSNNNANNNSNNINSSNYVPSSPSSTHSNHSIVVSTPASAAASNPAALSVSYSTAPSTALSVAGANNGTTVLSLSKQLTTLPGGVVTVTNGNGTTNTIYQGQQKQQTVASNNNTNNTSSASSTTHHPHKKYLREKMNVLDHGGGGYSSGGGGVIANTTANNVNTTNGAGNAAASTITVVASPASSSSSFSSSVSVSSSSSSTAAVNGGNSPVSKSFYAGAANNSTVNGSTSNSGAINYSSTANTTPPVVLGSVSAVASNGVHTITSSPMAASLPPTYAIMQYQSVASSPSISSPEPNNSKEMYPLIAPQQQQQRNSMRSPTSYSSYDNDSLKDFEISTNGSSGLGRNNTSTPQHQMHQSTPTQQQLSSGSSASSKNSHSGSIGGGSGANANGAVTPQKQKHPNNVPYDPFVHTHNKPPYSFSSLIFMAIEGSNEKALPVKEIYAWIMQHFPYFKTAPAGWKNSVRHNLSLNKSFVKVEKAPNMGKGSLWRVEPQQRQNLIQALNRSPFFPNSAVDKSASLKSPGGNDSLVGYDTVDSVGSSGGGACSPAPKSNINPRIDPRLYPKLSKVIGGQDVPDEDTPSDYSTTNHNSNLNNHNSSSNNKYNTYNSSPVPQNAGSGGGTSILGPFSSYESIERLARDCGADSIDDVNAATAMLALKHGPKVFAETFQNGAPVITSSPSEDHTYSAGGGAGAGGGANSGSTTPVANGSAAPLALNGNTQYAVSGAQQLQNGCNVDNQSNYTSSDAAYESSEDNNNITPEELEDQRRQREGVDALLSLSRSSVVESPTKRPSSTSVEEEHLTACLESNKVNNNNNNNNNNGHFTNGNGKMALLTSAVAYSQQQQHHLYEDSGSFHSPSYYGTTHSGAHQLHHHLGLAGGSAQRKIKPLRSLRTKIKRKAPWMSKAR